MSEKELSAIIRATRGKIEGLTTPYPKRKVGTSTRPHEGANLMKAHQRSRSAGQLEGERHGSVSRDL
jgi:hypothetical protein